MARAPGTISTAQLKAVGRQLKLLRVHFDKIDRDAWDLIVERRTARDREGWARAVAARRRLWEEFDRAETLILDRLTSPDALARTRTELEGARRQAVTFVSELQQTKLSLEKLDKAVGVITATVATLTEVIT